MKPCSLFMGILGAVLLASTVYAQASAVPGDLKQAYTGVKNDILQAAEKMPDADYSYMPTPQERNFGGWVAHVAEAQMGACSGINGARKRSDAGSKTSKADLVAALKESFDECDKAIDGTTESNMNEPVPSFRGQTPRIAALFGNISHDNECYGSMAVYLRMKGIVPPSTEMMQKLRGGKKKK